MDRSTEDRAQELFEDSVELVRKQKPRLALLKLLDLLAIAPQDERAIRAAAKLTGMLGDRETTQVLERVLDSPDDARALYELGYRLVAAGRPDVGAAFLRRCHEAAPENELVEYELGYALFSARSYREACDLLEAAIGKGELSPSEHAEALLLLCEASVYANRLEAAHAALDRTRGVELSDEQSARADALALLLGRASASGDLARLDLRGWHFVQHGGILLRLVDESEVEGARGGRLLDASPGYGFTAAMVKLGALLLTRLGLRYEHVFAGSDLSVPLAVAAARLLGAEASPFDPESLEPGLIVAKNLDELRQHQERLGERGEIDLFCLQLDWTRNQSLTPDVVGYLARHSHLPWEARPIVESDASGRARIKEPEAPGDLDQATQDLIAVCERLELSDELKNLERFYRPRREQLVIGQPDRYPRRRVFTAHSPIVTDEHIFP
jgi:tetratricopeptide (TPR) repeat protein